MKDIVKELVEVKKEMARLKKEVKSLKEEIQILRDKDNAPNTWQDATQKFLNS